MHWIDNTSQFLQEEHFGVLHKRFVIKSNPSLRNCQMNGTIFVPNFQACWLSRHIASSLSLQCTHKICEAYWPGWLAFYLALGRHGWQKHFYWMVVCEKYRKLVIASTCIFLLKKCDLTQWAKIMNACCVQASLDLDSYKFILYASRITLITFPWTNISESKWFLKMHWFNFMKVKILVFSPGIENYYGCFCFSIEVHGW